MFMVNCILRSGLAVGLAASSLTAFEPERSTVVIRGGSNQSYLGIHAIEIDAERAKDLQLKEVHGVEVTKVEEDGPASKAGLKTGDVVLEYNGQRVEGMEQFLRLVRETPAGREVKLSISRAGVPQTLIVKTGQRKTPMARFGEIEIPRFEMPEMRLPDVPRAHMSWRSSAIGIEAETLDSQLAEYFGVKEGVLVRSVIRTSAADKAGIKAGDVILKVDDTKVGSPREISEAVRGARLKKQVAILIVRDRREITVMLSIDEESDALNPPRRLIRAK
jgi:serine protease Do